MALIESGFQHHKWSGGRSKNNILARERGQTGKNGHQSAYCIVPVHPDDHLLLGMMWNGNLFINCALSFGLRYAPRIFSAIVEVLEWREKFEGIPNILDDFLTISPLSSGERSRHLYTLLALFEHLRVPVAPEKIEGPAMCITFLGIEINSNRMILHLPHQKLKLMVEESAKKLSQQSSVFSGMPSR